jgi:hypothetical protein
LTLDMVNKGKTKKEPDEVWVCKVPAHPVLIKGKGKLEIFLLLKGKGEEVLRKELLPTIRHLSVPCSILPSSSSFLSDAPRFRLLIPLDSPEKIML